MKLNLLVNSLYLSAMLSAQFSCEKEDEKADAGVSYDAGSSIEDETGMMENPCTMEGDVLFEDEFNGEKMDESKWYSPSGILEGQVSLSDGVLDIKVANGGVILQSHSTYVIDERPLIFESRWKVREREGTYIDSGFVGKNIDGDGVLFGRGSYTDWLLSYDIGAKNCGGTNGPLEPEPDLTMFHTFKAVIYRERVSFCVDGELKERIGSNCLPIGRDLTASLTCQSEDGQEKGCNFEYVRIMQGR